MPSKVSFLISFKKPRACFKFMILPKSSKNVNIVTFLKLFFNEMINYVYIYNHQSLKICTT